MTAEGAGSEYVSDVSNIRLCPCHDVPCIWSEIDRFHFEYRSELRRAQSFFANQCRIWPHDYPTWNTMASAGFFYTGISDFVRCFECCLLIGGWELLRQDPLTIHRNKSRRCRFVQGVDCGNVSYGITSPNRIRPMLRTHNDVLAMYGDVIQANIRLPRSNNVSDSLDQIDSTIPNVVDDIRASQYPQYSCYSDRLRSFNTWSVTKVQMKEAMAYAGFYYTGKGDKIQCYHCGLELCDWQPKGYPLLQHIKMFSKCMHIIKVVEEIISMKAAKM